MRLASKVHCHVQRMHRPCFMSNVGVEKQQINKSVVMESVIRVESI